MRYYCPTCGATATRDATAVPLCRPCALALHDLIGWLPSTAMLPLPDGTPPPRPRRRWRFRDAAGREVGEWPLPVDPALEREGA